MSALRGMSMSCANLVITAMITCLQATPAFANKAVHGEGLIDSQTQTTKRTPKASSNEILASDSATKFDLIQLPPEPLGAYSLIPPSADEMQRLIDCERVPIEQRKGVLKVQRGTGLYLKTCYDVVDSPVLLHKYAPNSLTGIEFGPMAVENDALKYLDQQHFLESIDIRNSDVTDDGFIYLANLQRLRWLNCASCSINGSGLRKVANLKGLIILNLSKNLLSDVDALTLFPQLRVLELRRCNLNDDSLTAISKLQKIERLMISENRISARGIAKLKALKMLTSLRVSLSCVTPKDVAAFKNFKSLKFLEVGGHGFSNEIARAWMKQLPGVAIAVVKGESSFPVEVFQPLH